MRIVIDMQGAQAENRNRGIGRLSFSLALAIARNSRDHDVILALNGSFRDTIEPIRAAFNDLIPQDNIRVWNPLGSTSNSSGITNWHRETNELLREGFLASLSPSIVLILSLFEGLVENATTSIGKLATTHPTAVFLHDLIPLIYRSPYLDNPVVELWYESKLAYLRRADLLLCNSDSTKSEGINYGGFYEANVVTVFAGKDDIFRIANISQQHEDHVRETYGLQRSFVMYGGGIDHRKNIEGLIRAYAKLPDEIRKDSQLAVVCAIQSVDRERLLNIARQNGFKPNELVLTGYVPEEDLIALYNLCKVFVFPSWHEGFGLPALEAMACGRAVIGANTSSLPEVIGCEEALFDPFDDMAIAEKLLQVLTDDEFRGKLEQHGLQQASKFSWDRSAKLAIHAMEKCIAQYEMRSMLSPSAVQRPRLAYISPLPPERSGISDYSAELLPELDRHYDIEVIVAQGEITTPWIRANCPIRTVDWFMANSARFDRVLYHFGNSTYHQHMFSMLNKVPGVVVLHDFFLSGILAHMEWHGHVPMIWTKALYTGHGYVAVQQRFSAVDGAEVVWKYPCNYAVLQEAQGLIVHSETSARLAQAWYGDKAQTGWAIIPLIKTPPVLAPEYSAKKSHRSALGVTDQDFVVCSFGLIGRSKLNHKLVDAWLTSPMAADEHCLLVFVGENPGDEYGQALAKAIDKRTLENRIRITGWVDSEQYKKYLCLADVAVQLRTMSRGETSAAVLDCLNHGLATIVNANGSMAELPDDTVWKLPDNFADTQLIEALTKLWRDKEYRMRLGSRATAFIRDKHLPRTCGDRYFSAIEGFYRIAASGIPALMKAVTVLQSKPESSEDYAALAVEIDRSIDLPLTQRQLLVDISELVQRDAKSGIQRVVRSILQEWLLDTPAGYRVEPVYATENQLGYRYARHFTFSYLNCPITGLNDDPISFHAGDVFLGLDLQPVIVPQQADFFRDLRQRGVTVRFVVYDLLLLQLPHCFPNGASHLLEDWLGVVAESDGAICISEAVMKELSQWLKRHEQKRERPFKLDWFHLGANIDRSSPTKGLPALAEYQLQAINSRTSFLMVGTIEPRKGYAETIDAFEQLWRQSKDINLVIVGKQGWMVDALVERIRNHEELDKRLFWLEAISDEYLEKVYAASTCLIAASYGEGFGLPLIEAAQHNLPIIARDIPVFREVAKDYAYYFDALSTDLLAQAIESWLKLYEGGHHPSSKSMPWLTWNESAASLANKLLTPH